MRAPITVLALCATLALAATASAVPGGKVIEFNKSPMGKVLFDGDRHKNAGASCKECHADGMFPKMKQGTVKITMEEINTGHLCGFCHNGKRAFGTDGNCARCHIKP
ncbi:MAG: c(7)-type cytochrome triheme domain-containing protein [Trichloromonadaceae bacterium]